MDEQTVTIGGVQYIGIACPTCGESLLRCAIDAGCCEQCVAAGTVVQHQRRPASPCG